MTPPALPTLPTASPAAATPTPSDPIPTDPTSTDPTPIDGERDDLAYLSGPAAGEIAAAVLAGEGVALKSWVLDRVHPRPGVGVTVGLVVHWSRPGGPPVQEYLCVTTSRLDARAATRPGVVALADGDRTLHLWRHPADPELPGLAAACQAVDADLDLVAYRPLRRAVVRVRPHDGVADGAADGPADGASAGSAVTYRKVVRPRRVEALHARHVLLRSAGVPVPASLGWTPDGVVTLTSLDGPSLAHALAADGARALDPVAFLDLLTSLPAAVCDLRRRAPWSEHALVYARGAAFRLPRAAAELGELGAQIAELVSRTDPGPVVPTHGDLYEANLLVTDAEITGLLDIDSVGPGHRVDDLACLLGHALVLPCLAPAVYPLAPAAVVRWLTVFDAVVDPAALRARVAAVVLSLVTGATGSLVDPVDAAGREAAAARDATARMALARDWTDAALAAL